MRGQSRVRGEVKTINCVCVSASASASVVDKSSGFILVYLSSLNWGVRR